MEGKKECPSCGEEIKAQAKKCPYCQSWQSKWHYDQSNIKHQLVFISILIGGMFLFFYGSFGNVFNAKEFPQSKQLLSVKESKISFTERACGSRLTVIGTITNNSDTAWKDFYFEARFYNDKNELIDTVSDQNYDLLLLANSESTFKVSGTAEKPESLYHSHEVIIKDAREKSSLF